MTGEGTIRPSVERQRVLIIVQNLPVPFDRRVWLEATTLAKHGHEVSVICPKMKGFDKSFERLEGVDIHRYSLPFDSRSKLGFIAEFGWCWMRTFAKTVRVHLFGPGFDVIHACNPPETYWLLGRFWKLFGKSFLFDHHDLSPEMYRAKFNGHSGEHGGLFYRGLLFLERRTFRAADVVITTNESHRQVAIERGGFDPDRVFLVRSGPDPARLRRHPVDPAWKKGKPFMVVYLGEMLEQDGVEILVEAVRILRDELARSDVHCVFVGGGSHQGAVQAYAEEIGVGELCTFTGMVSDETLCRVLSSADVGVDPVPKNDWSDRSTMNKIIEYMFFGLPVVAFDLTETRRSAEGAGAYATPNSALDLARMIAAVLEDPNRRSEMAVTARQRFESLLGWEHSVPNLLAAYRLAFASSGDRSRSGRPFT